MSSLQGLVLWVRAGQVVTVTPVPGVADVSVTLQPAAANVAYDAARTNIPALKAAIEDAGYGTGA